VKKKQKDECQNKSRIYAYASQVNRLIQRVDELEVLNNSNGPRLRMLEVLARDELHAARKQIKELVSVVERLTRKGE
jgi:hypothetical protein